MIKLTKRTHSEANILKLVDKEFKFITESLDSQKTSNSKILLYIKSFSNDININDESSKIDKFYANLNLATKTLKKSNQNVSLLEKLSKKLQNLKKGISFDEEDNRRKIDLYNQLATKYLNTVDSNSKDLDKFLQSISDFNIDTKNINDSNDTTISDTKTVENNITITEELPIQDQPKDNEEKHKKIKLKLFNPNSIISVKTNIKKIIDQIKEKSKIKKNCVDEKIKKQINNEVVVKNNISSNNLVENTLIISQAEEKIILPYTFEEIDKILQENSDTYKSRESVVEALYTRSLKDYRYASIVRFREAFKLAREKEHTSIIEALELALELFANYNLHPAIITACKNLNELDIYLSCLEYNELDDFHFFQVIFKVAPMIV